MDEEFAQLAGLLQFRDKEKDIRDHVQAKRNGTLSEADQEFVEWDKEMKQYIHLERKVKATDRTKTAEELAKEEAERLQELETRRLARMNGDFEKDDFSDIDLDDIDFNDGGAWKNRRMAKKARVDHPEALDNDSDGEDDDGKAKIQTRFTADGLVQVDIKTGKVLGKIGESAAPATSGPRVEDPITHYTVGTKVTASYRAKEQFDVNESWFGGTIAAVHGSDGTYDVEYDDGDFEEHVDACHIKPADVSLEELATEIQEKDRDVALKRKRQKAKEKAR
jgi:nucleolar protein 14